MSACMRGARLRTLIYDCTSGRDSKKCWRLILNDIRNLKVLLNLLPYWYLMSNLSNPPNQSRWKNKNFPFWVIIIIIAADQLQNHHSNAHTNHKMSIRFVKTKWRYKKQVSRVRRSIANKYSTKWAKPPNYHNLTWLQISSIVVSSQAVPVDKFRFKVFHYKQYLKVLNKCR